MLSLNECRKILSKDDKIYTDEEIIEIRNWVNNMADIALTIVDKNGIDNLNEIIDRRNKK